MTQSQIQYFLAVAQAMSFSKAAEALYVSQPAVSRQVLLLEQEIGVPLFDRTNQGITITDAGREFERFFRDTQRQFQELLDRTRNGSESICGTVNIGCAEAWDLSEFYPALSGFIAEKYPNLTLNLTGLNHDRLFPALHHDEVDVVITMESLLRGHKEISSALLTQRSGLLLFSAHHPLAKKEGLALADFKDDPSMSPLRPPCGRPPSTFSPCVPMRIFLPSIEYVPHAVRRLPKAPERKGSALLQRLDHGEKQPHLRLPPSPAQAQTSAWPGCQTTNRRPPICSSMRCSSTSSIPKPDPCALRPGALNRAPGRSFDSLIFSP